MIDLLKGIFNGIKALGEMVLWALVSFINLLVEAVGAVIEFVFSILPEMPPTPEAPDSGVLQWITWVLPMGGLIAGFLIFLGIWSAFLVVRVIGRWVKVL
jgi:hypothetical protein